MEISRRYKIYIAIIIAVAVTLTLRWSYYHNKWRTIEMRKDGYRVSYPANWFNTTHQAIRGPVGKWISLEVTNFPFVNSIMVRVYVDNTHYQNMDLDTWQLKIIQQDGGVFWKMNSSQPLGEKEKPWVNVFWSEPFTMPMHSLQIDAQARVWIDDVGYRRELVAFYCGDDICGVELLALQSQWQNGLDIFQKVLNSFQLLNEGAAIAPGQPLPSAGMELGSRVRPLASLILGPKN